MHYIPFHLRSGFRLRRLMVRCHIFAEEEGPPPQVRVHWRVQEGSAAAAEVRLHLGLRTARLVPHRPAVVVVAEAPPVLTRAETAVLGL